MLTYLVDRSSVVGSVGAPAHVRLQMIDHGRLEAVVPTKLGRSRCAEGFSLTARALSASPTR